jgi:hypothetical protein
MDKKDLFTFFLSIKNLNDVELAMLFENYEITKLDINRIYRYLDKYIKETDDDVVDDNVNADSLSDCDTELV